MPEQADTPNKMFEEALNYVDPSTLGLGEADESTPFSNKLTKSPNLSEQ